MFIRIAALLLTGFLAGCGAGTTEIPVAPEPEAVEPEVPHADAPKWSPVSEDRTFDTSNIWDAINGAADLYIAYGFRQLTMREYEHEGVRVSLDIFDQGTAINAFGIFRRERPPESTAIEAGAEAAIAPPYHCMMYKGQSYVRVHATNGEITTLLCESLLSTIAQDLPGEANLPDALDLLPSEKRIEGSEGFTAKSYLGLANLTGCLHAEYELGGGKTGEMFAIIQGSEQTGDKLWEKPAGKWKNTKVGALPSVYRDVPYKGVVVITKTPEGIIGISGAGDLEAAQSVLERAIERRMK